VTRGTNWATGTGELKGVDGRWSMVDGLSCHCEPGI